MSLTTNFVASMLIKTFSMHFQTSLSGPSGIYALPFLHVVQRTTKIDNSIICASFLHGVKSTPEIDISVLSAFLIKTVILLGL